MGSSERLTLGGSFVIVRVGGLSGRVGAEEIAGRNDADEVAVTFDEDVADVVLHHLLGDVGDVCVGVAPHELAVAISAAVVSPTPR